MKNDVQEITCIIQLHHSYKYYDHVLSLFIGGAVSLCVCVCVCECVCAWEGEEGGGAYLHDMSA